MNMTMPFGGGSSETKDVTEWEQEMNMCVTPERFGGILRELRMVGYQPDNIESRLKQCWCRGIALPGASTPEIKVQLYMKRYGEECPVIAKSLESYRQAYPDDDMKWWEQVQELRKSFPMTGRMR